MIEIAKEQNSSCESIKKEGNDFETTDNLLG